jgi:hypothetical protein
MKETKWFLGENSKEVFAVYKASFEGSTITDEVKWFLPTADSWTPTRQVSEWFWIGNDTVWPCDQALAKQYLPESAFKVF